MINHYCDLTKEEKIILCEIINRNKTETAFHEAEPNTASWYKQEIVVSFIENSIKNQLNEGEGLEMTKVILEKIKS